MAALIEIEPGTPAFDGLRLAGFALAHAAWSAEGGPGVVPIGVTRQGDEHALDRFVIEMTNDTVPFLWQQVAAKVAPGQYGALAFESVVTSRGEELGVINVHLVDHEGELIGEIRQAFRHAQKSRIPGRSRSFTVVGTPVPSDEIDLPGTREAVLVGVMAHPEGERIFPELAGFAQEIATMAELAARREAPPD